MYKFLSRSLLLLVHLLLQTFDLRMDLLLDQLIKTLGVGLDLPDLPDDLFLE